MNHHLDHAYKLGQQLAEFEKQASLARAASRLSSRSGSAARTARVAALDYGTLGAGAAAFSPMYKNISFLSPDYFQRLGIGTGLGALIGGVGGLAYHKLAPRSAARYTNYHMGALR